MTVMGYLTICTICGTLVAVVFIREYFRSNGKDRKCCCSNRAGTPLPPSS